MAVHTRSLVVIGILTLLACGAWTAVALDDHHDWNDDSSYYKSQENFSADLSGITAVKISNINGSIKATLGSANKVDILVNEKVNEKVKDGGFDPADMAREIKLVSHKDGNTLVVELDYGKYKDEKKYRGYYNSSFEVTLPARLNVGLETTNGSIVAPKFEGDINLETTNGSINAEGCSGNATLETTNGSVTVGMVKGVVKAETTNGNVTVTSSAGPVNAETTNGAIEVSLTEALAGDMSLSTTNGSITFKAGPGSSYSVEADTTNGRVSGPDALTFNKRRNTAHGSVNGGKYKVTMEATNGSIRIQ